MTALMLDLESIVSLTDDQYYELCRVNRDLRIERTAQGKLMIMSPTGGETGNRNIEISYQLQAWSRRNSLGFAFDSSTEFKLPNGANYSPDASWVKREEWDRLTAEQKRKFPPIAPDFVIELRSETDSLKQLREKMQEYMKAGVQLGWLIDPKQKQVEIYKLGRAVEIIENAETVSGEDVLPEFVLDLKPIFSSI
jgi:Uma2 family endonuclease